MNSPIQWFGGKGRHVQHILPFIEACEHKTYVEPFFGGGSVFFAKKRSEIEIVNDLNGDVVNFYRVLRDHDLFAEFKRRVGLTPYSREEYREAMRGYREGDQVERARMFFAIARMSFGGRFGSGWGSVVTQSVGGKAVCNHSWQSAKARLPEVHERLEHTQIECADALRVISRFDRDGTLFYLDPPYVAETRTGGGYECEMTDEDHRKLVELLLTVKGKVILSGYDSELYDPLCGAGWRKATFLATVAAAGSTQATELYGPGAKSKSHQRIETIWTNFDGKQMDLFGGYQKK